MAQEQPPGGIQVARLFEQPVETLSAYSDFAQVLGTPNEVVLQFYETIPDVPGPDGQIQSVRSRLKATIVLSHALATNIGNLLLQHAKASQGTAPSAAPDETDTSTEGGG